MNWHGSVTVGDSKAEYLVAKHRELPDKMLQPIWYGGQEVKPEQD